LAALVQSPAQMQRRVFAHASRELLARFRADGRQQCAELIQAYWNGSLAWPGTEPG